MARWIRGSTWCDYTKYGQLESQWILTPTSRCLSEKPTRNSTLWPSVVLTWHYGGGRGRLLALKASECASPAIKTERIPNTNVDSVKHKHWKVLTNTPATWYKPYAYTNKQCTKHKLIQQIESWQMSQSFHMTNLNMMITAAREAFAS